MAMALAHCREPDAGPIKNPRYLAAGLIWKSLHLEMLMSIKSLTKAVALSMREGEIHRGIRMHLSTLSSKPATNLAREIIPLHLRSSAMEAKAAPMSSAQALMTP